MERKTRATGASVLIALGTLAATVLLLAGPAGAMDDPTSQHSGDAAAIDHSTASGGCVAVNGSVCSGSGAAIDHSTSSGSAVAVHGSTSSGCAEAFHHSTASGGNCAPPEVGPPSPHRPEGPGVEEVPSAGAATPTAVTSLAFTGSSTGPLAAAGAAALALGIVLLALTSERRRPAHSS